MLYPQEVRRRAWRTSALHREHVGVGKPASCSLALQHARERTHLKPAEEGYAAVRASIGGHAPREVGTPCPIKISFVKWQPRMQRLADFVQAEGRLPRCSAKAGTELQIYQWLSRQLRVLGQLPTELVQQLRESHPLIAARVEAKLLKRRGSIDSACSVIALKA